ncbi:hypothetical protein I4F81_009866 [Pyropia yezoensis]|uniref:Uncharacterized protein n=1 Tax=Pyropia yezoensis TaxID=2788 RepID=A0ACC3CB17_PYRYE|nr:hypothetical protein I4F81_009866 [Neopyropia yezoensis]
MSYMSYNPMDPSTPTLGGATVLADAPVTGFGDWQEWLAEGGDGDMLPALPATLPSDLFGLPASSSLHAADDRSGVTERCVLLSTGELCSSTSPLPDQWLPSACDSGADTNDLPSLVVGMMTPSASTENLPLPSPLMATRRTPQLPTSLVREDFSPLTTPARSVASGNAAVSASPLMLNPSEVKSEAAKALDDLVAAGVSPSLARRALSGNWEGTTSAKARKMTGEQRTVTLFLRRLRNRISAKKSRLQRQAALAGLSDKAVALYLSAADVHKATKVIAERNVKLRRSVAVLEAQNGALTDLLSVRKATRGGGDARLPRAIAGA